MLEVVIDPKPSRYSMKSPERPKLGKAVVFNNKEFAEDTPLKSRPGSTKDAEDIKNVLKKIGFDVDEIYEDMTQLDATKKLHDIVKDDELLKYNCFIGVFLSHGDRDTIFMHDGQVLNIQSNILSLFRQADQRLGGKPKIFIVQACRGTDYEQKGKCCPSEKPTTESPSADLALQSEDEEDTEYFQEGEIGNKPTTPKGADFLVCYPSAEGTISFRNKEDGSWFIQSIVDVLTAYMDADESIEIDFASLMTRVAEMVSEHKANTRSRTKLQIPCMVSTLKKQIILPKHIWKTNENKS